jgi:hypothetical protein
MAWISLRRCDETTTVRPPVVRDLSRSRAVGNLERKVVHRNEIPEAPRQPIRGQRPHRSARAADIIPADFLPVEEAGLLEPVEASAGARLPLDADSLTANRLGAMQRGQWATASDGSRALIVSPQRGQIRYAGSGWRRRSLNRRSVAPGEVICHHAVHVI